jgi:hypothetical protein
VLSKCSATCTKPLALLFWLLIGSQKFGLGLKLTVLLPLPPERLSLLSLSFLVHETLVRTHAAKVLCTRSTLSDGRRCDFPRV